MLVEKLPLELKSLFGFVSTPTGLTSDPWLLGCPLHDSGGLSQCSQRKLHVAPRQDSAVDSQVSNTIFLKALLGTRTCRPPCCWLTAGGVREPTCGDERKCLQAGGFLTSGLTGDLLGHGSCLRLVSGTTFREWCLPW